MPTFDLGQVVGPQGPKGNPGDQGVQGIQGIQGVPGNDGVTPNIQVGVVTTLPAGSQATVTRQESSPDAAPVFDFGIPKGMDAENPGDMHSSVYDPTGQAKDIFGEIGKQMPKTGGTFTGVVGGVSPTSGSAKGFRNIYFGSGSPASSLGANGDIYFDIG